MSDQTTPTEPVAPEQAGAAVPGRDLSPEAVQRAYLLQLADDALIYSQRLGEWISRSPEIEEDMAIGNVALDLLGQARALLTRVGEVEGQGRSEDDLAYFRDEREFTNVHLVEAERGNFADEMARMLWFSAYQFELYSALTGENAPANIDETLSGVARKALKEVAYHRDHATMWVLRLGDGTELSHERMTAAIKGVAMYVSELFHDDEVSVAASEQGLGVLPSTLEEKATAYVHDVWQQATLEVPEPPVRLARGGRDGVHSEAMGYLLAEMQHIARSHPGATW